MYKVNIGGFCVKKYEEPKLKIQNLELLDVLCVSMTDDTLNPFDFDENL